MIITIDKTAGFCPGVHRAIHKAEKELEQDNELFSYGSLLHNELEMQRLQADGLRLAEKDDMLLLNHKKLLIRAHGEPPETYMLAKTHGVELIDATCPVVKRLQQKVRRAAEEMKKVKGQILIFGKQNHPEVIGLSGHAMGLATVISSAEDIAALDLSRPVRLFSQTTMDSDHYNAFALFLDEEIRKYQPEPDFISHDSICHHVTKRVPALKKFAANVDVIIFVSGKESSNGKKLFNICLEINPETYFVSKLNELRTAWFEHVNSVGISGAASTPLWLMEDVAAKIKEMN
ncbi:MAG: 4-hydroxy-3-methylbut-2-enyl diphosphate reductase [Bacteroidetes bacterium]|nr:4-hydroxy-3-methylbut-2-enyl diphosphate reductase [Bacteroidota bacterium]